MYSKNNHAQSCKTPSRLWSSKCVCMVCVRQESLVTSPLRCSWMWHQVMYLPLSSSVLHGGITIFFSLSKENNFEITISCFDKYCVGNSTLTFITALCRPAWRDTQSSVHYVYINTTLYDIWMYQLSGNKRSKRKVLLGKLQLEHILVYFHNPFQLICELAKKSNLVTHAFSVKPYTRDTDSLHSCTRLSLVQEMACLYHSSKIWPRKHTYPNFIPKR